jgi:hypothetical protein
MKEAEDLKKLDPVERMKKLKVLLDQKNKEIAEKNKEISEKSKEIEEAQKLSVEAENETEELIELQKKVHVPEIETIDITKLFEREGSKLEDKVDVPSAYKDVNAADSESGIEAIKGVKGSSFMTYNLSQAQPTAPIQDMYSGMRAVYSSAMEHGEITPGMATMAGAVVYAMEKKQEAINSGFYSPNEEMLKQANAAKDIADKILSLYTAGVKKKDGVHLWP